MKVFKKCYFKLLLVLVIIGLFIVNGRCRAANENDKVLARVNDRVISLEEFNTALQQYLTQQPEEIREKIKENINKENLIENKVRLILYAQAGKKAGLDKDPAIIERIKMYRDQSLRDMVMSKDLEEKIKKPTQQEIDAQMPKDIPKENRDAVRSQIELGLKLKRLEDMHRKQASIKIEDKVVDQLNEKSKDSLVLAKVNNKELKLGEIEKFFPGIRKADINTRKALVNNAVIGEIYFQAGKNRKYDQKDEYQKAVKNIEDSVLSDAYLLSKQKEIGDIKIEPEKIKKYYNDHKKDYKLPDGYRRVRHILIPFGKDQKEAEAKSKGESILKEIKQEKDFAKLAEKHSKCPTAPGGGLLPPFTRNSDYVKEFEDASFKLNEEEVSGLVKAYDGYHIIKREPDTLRLDEVKDLIKQTLQMEKFVSDLKAKAKIKINKDLL